MHLKAVFDSNLSERGAAFPSLRPNYHCVAESTTGSNHKIKSIIFKWIETSCFKWRRKGQLIEDDN